MLLLSLYHPLTELLLADYLVVDASRPYATDSFFEIEQANLTRPPNVWGPVVKR